MHLGYNNAEHAYRYFMGGGDSGGERHRGERGEGSQNGSCGYRMSQISYRTGMCGPIWSLQAASPAWAPWQNRKRRFAYQTVCSTFKMPSINLYLPDELFLFSLRLLSQFFCLCEGFPTNINKFIQPL
jgi:hypothetical protein